MQAHQARKLGRRSIESRTRLVAALAGVVFSGGVISQVTADTWTWVGGGSDFNWSDGANWSHTSGSSNSATPLDINDTVVDFAGSNLLIPDQDIANPILLNSLGFSSGASPFILVGDTLDFCNNTGGTGPTIVQNSSNTQMIAQTLSLTNTLTFTGSGTGGMNFDDPITASGGLIDDTTAPIELLATNTYSGGTKLETGAQLTVSNQMALGTGTLTFAGGTLTGANVILPNTFTHSSGAAVNIQAEPSDSLTVTPIICDFGSLNFGSAADTGSVLFDPLFCTGSGGQLNVNGGTLVDSSDSLSPLLYEYAVSIVSGATFDLKGNSTIIESLTGTGTLATGGNSSETFTLRAANFSGNVTGSGALVVAQGTVTLSGTNTYSGGTTLSSGQLNINSANAIGVGSLALVSGTLVSSATTTFQGPTLSDLSSSPVTIEAKNNTTLTLQPINLSVADATYLNFGSANATGQIVVEALTGYFTTTGMTGQLNVNGGTVTDGNGELGAVSVYEDWTVTVTAPATLNQNGYSANVYDLLGNGNIQTGTSSSQTLTLQNANFSGLIAGSGNLEVIRGTVVLSSPNTYSGGTVLAFCSLGVGNTHALSGSGVTVLGSAELYSTVANQTLNNPISINSGQTLTVVDNPAGAHGLTLESNISGSGGIEMSGSNTLSLTAANNYSGGTTVSSGDLVLGATGALPTGGSVVNYGTLTVQANNVAGNLTGTGALVSDALLLQLAASTGPDTVGAIAITPSATVDVTNNTLFVDYNAGADPIASIRNYLTNGYASGEWTGKEIDSSTVANLDSTQSSLIYSIGYADGADNIVSGLSSGQIEILPTLAGDAKMQGNVVFGDFQLLSQYFGQTGTSWDEGNFTYGSSTNFGDFQLLSQNFGANASGLTAGEIASLDGFVAQFGEMLVPDGNGFSLVSVPEPASLGLLAVSGIALLGRRRRGR